MWIASFTFTWHCNIRIVTWRQMISRLSSVAYSVESLEINLMAHVDAREANIDYSPVCDTSCLDVLFFPSLLCGKCTKPVTIQFLRTGIFGYFNRERKRTRQVERGAILELATNFWLLVLSSLHNHKRIIKQASLSHWGAEYNLKVSNASCAKWSARVIRNWLLILISRLGGHCTLCTI